MLDIKLLRENFQEVKEKLQARGEDLSDLDQFEAIDQKRWELIAKTEILRAKQNEVSKEITFLKRDKKYRWYDYRPNRPPTIYGWQDGH